MTKNDLTMLQKVVTYDIDSEIEILQSIQNKKYDENDKTTWLKYQHTITHLELLRDRINQYNITKIKEDCKHIDFINS